MKHSILLLCFAFLIGCQCVPQSISVQLLEADSNCQAILPDYAQYLSIKENCSGYVITQQPEAGTVLNNNLLPYTKCYLFVTDDAGNLSEVSFDVLLLDNTPPVITVGEELLTYNPDEIHLLQRAYYQGIGDLMYKATNDSIWPDAAEIFDTMSILSVKGPGFDGRSMGVFIKPSGYVMTLDSTQMSSLGWDMPAPYIE